MDQKLLKLKLSFYFLVFALSQKGHYHLIFRLPRTYSSIDRIQVKYDKGKNVETKTNFLIKPGAPATCRRGHIKRTTKDEFKPSFVPEGKLKAQDGFKSGSNFKQPQRTHDQEFKRPYPKVKTSASPKVIEKPPQLKEMIKPNANRAAQVSPQKKSKQAINAAAKSAKPSQATNVKAQDTKQTQANNKTTQKVAQPAQNAKPTQSANVASKKTESQKDGATVQSNKLAECESPSRTKQQGNVEKPTTTKGSPNKEETENTKADEPPTDKHELDPLMTQVLDEELQDIMIQVWQELPDHPEDEDEKFVVDKLRNEVGDDLRRILGLNVTKRILNVFNNLLVKIHFTCRPQMGCLTTFLSTYNINKFKRIDKDSNVFAAQMMTIEDFDRLCLSKELACGEAKVTVTPCYKFSECPENLKTIYDDAFYYEDNTIQEHAEYTKYVEDETICEKSDDTQTKTNKKETNDIDIDETDLDMEILENDLEDYMEVEENDLEGDEELDDEDILALMTEGVVVDECSGSDDEK